MSIAYAHGLYDRPPAGLFELKWDWDPTLLFFILITYLYVRGLRKFKNRSPVKPWQRGFFFAGIGVMSIALLPPVDPLSDRLFFMHMVQHLLITLVGVPMIILGVPYFVILRGAPNWFRRHIFIPLLRNRPLQAVLNFLGKPLPALMLFEFNFWFWHVPRFYNMALFNDVYHFIEHATFAMSAMFLWRNIIDPYPMKSRLPLPARLLFIGAVMASDIVLSAFLTFTDSVWYGYEGIPVPDWWLHWGHLEDQRLGGLIMWIGGGMVYLIMMTAIFFVWAAKEEKKDKDARALEAATVPVTS